MGKKKVVYPVLFMILLTAFFATALAVLDYVSEDIIAKQEAKRVQSSILYVFNQTVDGDVSKEYDARVTEETLDGTRVYYLMDNNEKQAYAIAFVGKGLWGQVSGFIAFDINSREVLGVDFVSHSETPGLGGRIDEIPFKEQFRGIDIRTEKDEYVVFKPADNGIDGISGATLTSKAVKDLINKSIQYGKALGVTN